MEDKKFYTIAEVADLLGISRISVFKRVKKGDMKAIRIGRIYAIPSSEFKSLSGESLTSSQKDIIDQAVSGTVSAYGEVLRRLGRD